MLFARNVGGFCPSTLPYILCTFDYILRVYIPFASLPFRPPSHTFPPTTFRRISLNLKTFSTRAHSSTFVVPSAANTFATHYMHSPPTFIHIHSGPSTFQYILVALHIAAHSAPPMLQQGVDRRRVPARTFAHLRAPARTFRSPSATPSATFSHLQPASQGMREGM